MQRLVGKHLDTWKKLLNDLLSGDITVSFLWQMHFQWIEIAIPRAEHCCEEGYSKYSLLDTLVNILCWILFLW